MTDAAAPTTSPKGVKPTINYEIARPSRAILERVGHLSTAELSDGMNRFNVAHHAIKPIAPGTSMVGPAFTVKLPAADNLFLMKATLMAQPGDVLVVDVGGDCSNAVLGDVIARLCQGRGLAGIVVDGAVRDVVGCREVGIPVFARAVTPAGPYKDGPGHINITVVCGSVPVRPGDIVVGDDDGVVIVPSGEAERICQEAEVKQAHDRQLVAGMAVGKFPFPWVDTVLQERGYLAASSEDARHLPASNDS